MEPMSIIDGIEKVIAIADFIKTAVERVAGNDAACKEMVRRMDRVTGPMEQLKDHVHYSTNLKKYVDELLNIMKDAEKIAKKLAEANKFKKFFLGAKYEAKLNAVTKQFKELSADSVFLILSNQYSNKDLQSAKLESHWSIILDEACSFSQVTDAGQILIGGKVMESSFYQIFCYDVEGNRDWHWQWPEDLGEPMDVAEINVMGQADERLKAIAISCPHNNTIQLFNPETRCLQKVFEMKDKEYRLGRLQLMCKGVLIVSASPVVQATMGLKSKLLALNCAQTPFKEKWTIPIDFMDVHYMCKESHKCVAVAGGRPEAVKVYDYQNKNLAYTLPQMADDKDIVPECLVSVGADMCVFDGSSQRLLATKCKTPGEANSGNTWGQTLLHGEDKYMEDGGLGEKVYSIDWHQQTMRLLVLQYGHRRHQMSLYSLNR